MVIHSINELVHKQAQQISELGFKAKQEGLSELSHTCACFVYDMLDWLRKHNEPSPLPINGFAVGNKLEKLVELEQFVESYHDDSHDEN